MFNYKKLRFNFSCFLSVLIAVTVQPSYAHSEETLTVESPDRQLEVSFSLSTLDGQKDCPTYAVRWAGNRVLLPSRMELTLEGTSLSGPFRLLETTTASHDEEWEQPFGERRRVRDSYNTLSVTLEERESPHRKLNLEFRAYNEGLAFRYVVPSQPGVGAIDLVEEHSEFRFAGDYTTWATYASQSKYSKTTVSRIRSGCERPLTVRASDHCYLAVGEARQVDYSRLKLGPLENASNALVSEIDGKVSGTAPFRTPWRVIMAAASPGELLENNDIFLNLNDPCVLEDISWIRPGKVIRDVSLTTQGAKACVDFAERHNLQYVIISAGWYGNEFTEASDASTVTLDPNRSKGPLDLHEVIRYGKEKGIGILVYVNRNQLEKQVDELHPLYENWGLKGIKYGFVRTGSQQWTNWLHKNIRDAAEHHLLINVHDDYRPTGIRRTYPHLMTMEGIRGDEESPSTDHTLITLFTRMISGPGDNTICYFADRVDTMGSHGAQLAKSVCLFSPMQWLYWYDRPEGSPTDSGGAGDSAMHIVEVPELEFFDALPTVWDDTKVLHGEIGEFAAVARRSGNEWYIGVLNGRTSRTLTLELDFLDANKQYIARVYSDDPSVQTVTHVRVDRVPVTSQSALPCLLAPQGGQAIRIVPLQEDGSLTETDPRNQ